MAKRKTRVEPVAIATTEPDPAKAHQVFLWIVDGKTEYQICQLIRAKFPSTPAGPLFDWAMVEIRKSGHLDALSVRGLAFEQARDLYRRMVETGDFSGALRAVKMILDMTKGEPLHVRPTGDEQPGTG